MMTDRIGNDEIVQIVLALSAYTFVSIGAGLLTNTPALGYIGTGIGFAVVKSRVTAELAIRSESFKINAPTAERKE
jgi:hypothetical protein